MQTQEHALFYLYGLKYNPVLYMSFILSSSSSSSSSRVRLL